MLSSTPKPLSRTFLVEGAYEAILENILSGTLPSGTVVSEVSLAHELNVSRSTICRDLAYLLRLGWPCPTCGAFTRPPLGPMGGSGGRWWLTRS